MALRSADQGPGEVARIEWPEVVEAFADADQLHRQAELVRDRNRDPALRGAVQLREGHAAHFDRLAEEPRLLETVLARGGVDHEQRLVRRPLEPLTDDAANLRE